MSASPVATALSRGITADLPELAARYLDEYLAKIDVATAPLDFDALWWRPAAGTNSIGNLMLHLCGNLSLWIGEAVGGSAYARERSAELAADRSHDRAQLMARLSEVISRCRGVLARLGNDDLTRGIDIQGYATNVLGAVFHAVEHMGYHTGQILYIAKQRLGDRPEGHGIELYPQHRGD